MGGLATYLRCKEYEELWKNSETKNLDFCGESIRRDAKKIIYFPLTIPRVRTLIKLRMLFQFLMPLGLIYVIMVIGFILHP